MNLFRTGLCPDAASGGLPLSRRQALLGLTAAVTLGRTSLALAAPVTEQRFVVILLRGALDGLSAVQPYGDPDFDRIRGELALSGPGAQGGLLDLGGMYGLHPSLPNVHTMYQAGDALLLHAVAGHYRSRSHFEAQDCLESGADERLNSGWLNRAVLMMPARTGQDIALSVGLSAPLLLRGPATVQAWAPDHFAQPTPDLYQRLLSISLRDPVIGPAMREGIKQRGFDAAALAGPAGSSSQAIPPNQPGHDRSFEVLAATAGRLLAQPDGPRVAALELGGWDTHAGQARRLEIALWQLDAGLAALKSALGASWRSTAVLAVTEFGRTAAVNGTGGTDHGTGGVALLCGGAVAGGKVRADWPGLGQGRLFENRDLAPTTDLRSVIKGVLIDHMGLPGPGLEQVLPGSLDAQKMGGLIRA
jgi:uncharacterized protein (DUF1501 family)